MLITFPFAYFCFPLKRVVLISHFIFHVILYSWMLTISLKDEIFDPTNVYMFSIISIVANVAVKFNKSYKKKNTTTIMYFIDYKKYLYL